MTTNDDLQCAQCGATTVSTSWVDDHLVWGSGDSAATLPVRVPYRSCGSCDFTYLDQEAEDVRHRAVCRHLGVLAPAEVAGIRKKYGMSQADFARVTGLGEATVGRWENGLVIQNVANDRYLRLLLHHDVMQLLQHLSKRQGSDSGDERLASKDSRRRKWRALDPTEQVIRDQRAFAGLRALRHDRAAPTGRVFT